MFSSIHACSSFYLSASLFLNQIELFKSSSIFNGCEAVWVSYSKNDFSWHWSIYELFKFIEHVCNAMLLKRFDAYISTHLVEHNICGHFHVGCHAMLIFILFLHQEIYMRRLYIIISIKGHIETICTSSCIFPLRSVIINFGFITIILFRIVTAHVLIYLVIFIVVIYVIQNYVHIFTIIVGFTVIFSLFLLNRYQHIVFFAFVWLFVLVVTYFWLHIFVFFFCHIFCIVWCVYFIVFLRIVDPFLILLKSIDHKYVLFYICLLFILFLVFVIYIYSKETFKHCITIIHHQLFIFHGNMANSINHVFFHCQFSPFMTMYFFNQLQLHKIISASLFWIV